MADDEVNDAASDADLTLHYRGQVFDPEGKAAAGAKIFLTCRRNGAEDEPWAVTGVDGQFDFTAQRSDFKPGGISSWLACDLVAMVDGLGFAAQARSTSKPPGKRSNACLTRRDGCSMTTPASVRRSCDWCATMCRLSAASCRSTANR